MKVTIYDVAKKGGVSISTASKALNDRKDVGDKTKERIREIAKDLKYEPSHFARTLAMRRTGNIGILTGRSVNVPLITNPYHSKIIEGIEDAIFGTDINLVTGVLRKEQFDNLEPPKMVREKTIDGLVLLGEMPEEYTRMIIDRGLPVVLVDSCIETHEADVIVADNEGGAYKAVDYLIKAGHKKIAFLSEAGTNRNYMLRRGGYLKALLDNGIEADSRRMITRPEGVSMRSYEWMEGVLKLNERPDALFMCNDISAVLVINMLAKAGLRVPEDISVVGFDDIEIAAHFIPSISTVNIPANEMGARAAGMLAGIMDKHGSPKEKIIMPAEFICRNSVKSR
jgi:LacI family transcriptional regulator